MGPRSIFSNHYLKVALTMYFYVFHEKLEHDFPWLFKLIDELYTITIFYINLCLWGKNIYRRHSIEKKQEKQKTREQFFYKWNFGLIFHILPTKWNCTHLIASWNIIFHYLFCSILEFHQFSSKNKRNKKFSHYNFLRAVKLIWTSKLFISSACSETQRKPTTKYF